MQNNHKQPAPEEHLGLVHLCANRFRNRGIAYEELYSAGCEGLVKAARAFDTERGVQFSTYAVPVILGEIKRLFRENGTVHVSRGLRELAMKVQQIREKSLKETGIEPTLSVLAEKADSTPEEVAMALNAISPTVSLTAPDENEGQIDIAIEAPDEKISDSLALQQVMALLAPQDRILLELRYYHNFTQVKTAEKLGMTQVQVSRREKKLLLYLRQELLK
ncbi:MAG: sigma-70 family RNA polymerase sigma factor [Oscillospiraceae bacterium]|nr:sigma-70 family RNA polymerase sigma factor [Ruminococcus sp.]MDE6708485.1 sigma-70 family RNA polymerase sigma factor [Oscillospiraceae bacterium]